MDEYDEFIEDFYEDEDYPYDFEDNDAVTRMVEWL